MLSATLADAFDLAATSAAQNVQTVESLGQKSVFQLVRESGGSSRFLASHVRLEDAMAEARVLNRADGKAYKVVLWGSGLPVQRPVSASQARGDNILPSLVYHPAAVVSHPEVLPISAVYKRGSEVIFTAKGAAVPTASKSFLVAGDKESYRGLTLGEAVELAGRRMRRSRTQQLVSVIDGQKGLTPVLRVHSQIRQGDGLGDLSVGLGVAPVTPADLLRRRAMQRA